MLLAGGLVAVLAACDSGSGQPPVEEFIERHWEFPVAPQGMPPDHFGATEASLSAESCGQCHVRQFEDWQTSRHSETMNDGLRWQLRVFSPADANSCMNCHTPLAEQKALVSTELGWPNAPDEPPPAHVPEGLAHEGLTCAGCHVRGNQRFGPEHRAGLEGDEEGLPHDGFTPHEAFSDSQFCAACHQFPDDGPRLNGKLRQDTHNEWLESEFAGRGVTCQGCHMPDRRHLWRGISDPQMTRDALALELAGQEQADGEVAVELEVANVGAGHHFPTYMVPRVDLRLLLVDADGEARAEVLHHPIQWKSSVDLTEEYFDHRIPSGDSVRLSAGFELPEDPEGWSLELHMDVVPKEFYERMYRDMLRQADRMDRETLALLQNALAEAEATRYRALRERIPLDGPIRLELQPHSLPWEAVSEAGASE